MSSICGWQMNRQQAGAHKMKCILIITLPQSIITFITIDHNKKKSITFLLPQNGITFTAINCNIFMVYTGCMLYIFPIG